MSLYTELRKAHTEEDLKSAYIKALGLKVISEGLDGIDIRTKEIWFEAKNGSESIHKMFTQLIAYVRHERKKGKPIAPFLAVIDREKAAIMETTNAFPVVEDRTIKWSKTPSQPTRESIEQVAPYIEAHLVVYDIRTYEKEFIQAIRAAINSGKFIRTPITPDNLKQVFDKWVEMIGKELEAVDPIDYALVFFADIMHDGKSSAIKDLPAKLLQEGGKPVFLLNGSPHALSSDNGYRRFWSIYHRPPEEKHRRYLLERRDSLLPLDERSFKGAFYTPLYVVDKAYDKLAQVLGSNWQKNYIVWDMCCGVGNLEIKHSNHRNIFMSTLDQADVDVMKATRTCVAAERFQYDYLNDDITDSGKIDYTITNKLPNGLREAIKFGKKILVLINPPYAEATNFDNINPAMDAKNKKGVARTKVAAHLMDDFGKASNELFVQFLARIAKEMPTATLAMFSTMKYINAPNFEKFRHKWNARFLDGFVIHNKAFDGLKGDFPIGFLVWETGQSAQAEPQTKEITVDAYSKRAEFLCSKTFYSQPKNTYLNTWIKRQKANRVPTIPLKACVTPADSKPRIQTWSENAIAYMYCGVNDLQHAQTQTALFSSVYQGGNGFYITPDNLEQAAVVFAVRRLIKMNWLNDRDQFLQPSHTVPDWFKSDSLVFMLFNNYNLTAGADNLPWEGKKWSLVNHFIPFTEDEVGAPERFESDFMVEYMKGRLISNEAQIVLDEARALWLIFHADKDSHATRQRYALGRPDVGWFQVRKALEDRMKNSAKGVISFDPFKAAFQALEEKMAPYVYKLGFLR